MTLDPNLMIRFNRGNGEIITGNAQDLLNSYHGDLNLLRKDRPDAYESISLELMKSQLADMAKAKAASPAPPPATSTVAQVPQLPFGFYNPNTTVKPQNYWQGNRFMSGGFNLPTYDNRATPRTTFGNPFGYGASPAMQSRPFGMAMPAWRRQAMAGARMRGM